MQTVLTRLSSAASDLSLHRLPVSLDWDTRYRWVVWLFLFKAKTTVDDDYLTFFFLLHAHER